jgi:hypothetical protein
LSFIRRRLLLVDECLHTAASCQTAAHKEILGNVFGQLRSCQLRLQLHRYEMRCFRYSNRNLNQQHSDNTAERATTPFLKGTPLMYRRNGKACVCQKNQGRINNGDEHGGMDIDVQDEIQVMADIAVCACLSQCGLLERMSQGQIHL